MAQSVPAAAQHSDTQILHMPSIQLTSALSIAKTTEGYAEKAAVEKLNNCIERLHAEFAESKQDKCHRLEVALSAIKQEHDGLVEHEFSF